MNFAQSFSNQCSSVLRINVMVVDDDPVFLQIMSRMLEKFKYRDPSVMEITVIAAKGSMEALSTLKIQRNNIDLIVTDYYMPGMNGLQLKTEITREFGNLPVIVMSSDNNKEQESLTCGAMCFITKPIKANDLTMIYQYALTYKRNGKSIIWSTEQNHKDTDVITVPRQIELLPEQANDSNIMKKKCSSGPDAKSGNSTNASCVSTNGSPKIRKRKSDENSGDDVESMLVPCKKTKVTWTDDLHDLFLQAIRHIGLDKAVPKKILQYMNIPYLTRENVASHLQKYRMFLRRVAERGLMFSRMLSGRGIDSTYPYAHMREPYHNYYTAPSSWYDTTLNNRSSSFSKPRHGLGQSRLLSNAPDTTIRRNQMPYNYMNRSSTYEPNRIGSSSTLPMIKSNLNFPNQRPSENKGKRSLFAPSMTTINEIGQTSQVRGFGKLGSVANNNGNSFNDDMMSSYGTLTPSQPGLNSYGSLAPNQTGVNNYGSLAPNQTGVNIYTSLTPNQTGVNSNGSLTPNQIGVNSYGSLTPNQTGVNSYGSLTPNQTGVNSYGSLTPNHTGLSNYGSSTPKQQGLRSNESLTQNQQGLSSYGSLTSNQKGLNSYGSLTPNKTGLSSYGTLTTNQQGLSSYGSLTPNQQGLSSYGTLTTNQQGLSSYGSLTSNRPGLSSYGILTLNQQRSRSFGSLTPYQPGSSSCGSLSTNQSGSSSFGSLTNQPVLSSYGSLTPTEPGSNPFSFGMQSFLNNENVAYTLPQTHAIDTTLPNIEIPQLEKLNLYDDFGNTNELPWEISNFQFGHNKEQGDQTSTKFDLPDFPSELNQIFSAEDDDDWTFVNKNQGHFNGDTSNIIAAPEMNTPTFNMNPNHNQEQDVPDFTDWSFLDVEELVDDDFMDSLFVNDMN